MREQNLRAIQPRAFIVSDDRRASPNLLTATLPDMPKAVSVGDVTYLPIIHSDRGSQYSSNDFRKLLKRNGLQQSMSGNGNR